MSAPEPQTEAYNKVRPLRLPAPEREAPWLRQHFVMPNDVAELSPEERERQDQKLRWALRQLEREHGLQNRR